MIELKDNDVSCQNIQRLDDDTQELSATAMAASLIVSIPAIGFDATVLVDRLKRDVAFLDMFNAYVWHKLGVNTEKTYRDFADYLYLTDICTEIETFEDIQNRGVYVTICSIQAISVAEGNKLATNLSKWIYALAANLTYTKGAYHYILHAHPLKVTETASRVLGAGYDDSTQMRLFDTIRSISTDALQYEGGSLTSTKTNVTELFLLTNSNHEYHKWSAREVLRTLNDKGYNPRIVAAAAIPLKCRKPVTTPDYTSFDDICVHIRSLHNHLWYVFYFHPLAWSTKDFDDTEYRCAWYEWCPKEGQYVENHEMIEGCTIMVLHSTDGISALCVRQSAAGFYSGMLSTNSEDVDDGGDYNIAPKVPAAEVENAVRYCGMRERVYVKQNNIHINKNILDVKLVDIFCRAVRVGRTSLVLGIDDEDRVVAFTIWDHEKVLDRKFRR